MIEEILSEVISDDRWFYDFRKFESIRASLKRNQHKVPFQEHGAGSQVEPGKTRTIASIASSSLSYPYQCRIMYRLVEHMEYRSVLELGTSLGLSALYLAGSNRNIDLYTIEGDPASHNVANHVFQELGMSNIHSSLGLFQEILPTTLKKMKTVDLAFIDGHHDKNATLEYFKMIQPYCSTNSAIVVDDIYWSKGMNEAWEQIRSDNRVTIAIDLFFCGIVFFTPDEDQVDLRIRPHKLLFHL